MQQPADVVVRPAIKHVPRSVVRDAHERIVRCGLGIVPVSSETEDKFEARIRKDSIIGCVETQAASMFQRATPTAPYEKACLQRQTCFTPKSIRNGRRESGGLPTG